MKARWITLGVAIGLVLAFTVGFGFASDRTPSNAGASTERWAGMESMHDSAGMRRAHAQMPEELQAQCDAMHEQMDEMMQNGGMMGGDMSSNHPGTLGGMGAGSGPGGMMGSEGPGGMMGSGPGGMMGS